MTDEFELTVSAREDVGKGASRRLRHAGKLPAIIYGGDAEPSAITIEHHTLYHAYERGNLTGLFSLNIDGKMENVVTRDVQHHPYKPFIQHIDFLRVNRKALIKVQVALNFVGEQEAPGVKLGGGTFSHVVNSIEIECPAGNIPEHIDVDVSGLNIGELIHLKEIKMPEGATIPAMVNAANETELEAANVVIVSITPPRASDEDEDEGGEASETKAEPES